MIIAGVILAIAAVPLVAFGQTKVGGDVPSFLELSLTQPNGFASFPSARRTLLAEHPGPDYGDRGAADDVDLDGSEPSGAPRPSGQRSTVLTAPIQVATSASSWASLGGSTDRRWPSGPRPSRRPGHDPPAPAGPGLGTPLGLPQAAAAHRLGADA